VTSETRVTDAAEEHLDAIAEIYAAAVENSHALLAYGALWFVQRDDPHH
jgi:L-amino acid N-acyltransferase YncA